MKKCCEQCQSLKMVLMHKSNTGIHYNQNNAPLPTLFASTLMTAKLLWAQSIEVEFSSVFSGQMWKRFNTFFFINLYKGTLQLATCRLTKKNYESKFWVLNGESNGGWGLKQSGTTGYCMCADQLPYCSSPQVLPRGGVWSTRTQTDVLQRHIQWTIARTKVMPTG